MKYSSVDEDINFHSQLPLEFSVRIVDQLRFVLRGAVALVANGRKEIRIVWRNFSFHFQLFYCVSRTFFLFDSMSLFLSFSHECHRQLSSRSSLFAVEMVCLLSVACVHTWQANFKFPLDNFRWNEAKFLSSRLGSVKIEKKSTLHIEILIKLGI